MTTVDESYDVVLWGATGFTGQLVAEYFAEEYNPTNLDWALAGRNKEKLEELRASLSDIDSGWSELPVLIGDANDQDSLDAIASKTNVVCSTVGPYAKYGTKMVAACVEQQTDYCDLTGEVQWIREMIDRFHEDALASGTRIVHSCGFDSVPSDIGTLMIQQHALEHYNAPCRRVRGFMSMGSAEFSGGTVASAMNLLEEASRDPSVRNLIENPYGLAPVGEQSGPDEGIQRWARYDEDLKMWTAPFLMALTNEQVVRRSNAVLGYPYDRDFSYRESIPTGTGWSGMASAAGVAAGVATMTGAASFKPLRYLLKRFVLPEPGEGPDRETIENGSFEVRLVGRGESHSGEPFRVSGKITSPRDPGYGSTSWMIGESAICLALGETDTPRDGGILTPASGIGLPLVDRLEATDMDFQLRHNQLDEELNEDS